MNTTWSSRSINPELVKGLVELASEERHNWDSWGNGFEWVTLMNAGQLPDAAALLAKHEARLCTVTALNKQLAEPVTTLAYHFDVHGYTVTVTVPLDPAENSVPTITPWFRNADWNEREFAELFEMCIRDRHLFLCAGGLIFRVGSRKLSDLAGLVHEMPWACLLYTSGTRPALAAKPSRVNTRANLSTSSEWTARLATISPYCVWFPPIMKKPTIMRLSLIHIWSTGPSME